MKYFYSFQKKKALPITKGTDNNLELVQQFNHELMQYGYIMTKELQDSLQTCSISTLDMIYHDLLEGIKRVIPGGGHEMIYKGFPESVQKLTHEEFINNAIQYYQSNGTWEPEAESTIKRTFKIELIDYKSVDLITEKEFENIFYNIIYSNNSINKFDKEVVEWFLAKGYAIDFTKITFKEIFAYVGTKLIGNTNILPTKNATDVLRIWSAFSEGDEGLKENTKFKNPNSRQRQQLLNTLNNCYNLEEEFKNNREKWLRLLFFLHPMAPKNRNKYSQVAFYADKLRNAPKELVTFNARIEHALINKNFDIFDLLSKRMGVFSRRLDHLIRVFGSISVDKWLANKPNVSQLINVYNHLHGRDKQQEGRTSILANQNKSSVVSYKNAEVLDKKVVEDSRNTIFLELETSLYNTLGKVFIAKELYYRPLASNNRASSLSLSGKAIGTIENVPIEKSIRAYITWKGSDDIDLSGLVITKNNDIIKVGWNGQHTIPGVTYSGDNTGSYSKNAEYLDIDPTKLSSDTEWIILDARIYRGRSGYNAYNGEIKTGWMLRDSNMQMSKTWAPNTVSNGVALNSVSNSAFLFAYHVPTNNVVYLDIAGSSNNISNNSDAMSLKIFLDKYIPKDNIDGINWDIINQGHVLHLLAKEVVNNPKSADKVYDVNTTQEEVAIFL